MFRFFNSNFIGLVFFFVGVVDLGGVFLFFFLIFVGVDIEEFEIELIIGFWCFFIIGVIDIVVVVVLGKNFFFFDMMFGEYFGDFGGGIFFFFKILNFCVLISGVCESNLVGNVVILR